jgi:hypothetical protein
MLESRLLQIPPRFHPSVASPRFVWPRCSISSADSFLPLLTSISHRHDAVETPQRNSNERHILCPDEIGHTYRKYYAIFRADGTLDQDKSSFSALVASPGSRSRLLVHLFVQIEQLPRLGLTYDKYQREAVVESGDRFLNFRPIPGTSRAEVWNATRGELSIRLECPLFSTWREVVEHLRSRAIEGQAG